MGKIAFPVSFIDVAGCLNKLSLPAETVILDIPSIVGTVIHDENTVVSYYFALVISCL